MRRFTSVGDEEVERVVERELEVVVNALVNLAGRELTTILLVGGFGRGEGGVVRDGARPRPMNDYDILVVLRSSVDPDLARRMTEELDSVHGSRLSVKQVDVNVTTGRWLAIPVPSVARYEIKHGHRVIWGRLRRPIRAVPAAWLPLHEGTKYYRHRGAGLLVARLLLDGEGPYDARTRRELIFLELNKAWLVNGDAHLILMRNYHCSYAERRNKVAADARQLRVDVDVAHAYARAVDERREVAVEDLVRRDLEAEWQGAGVALLTGFLEFESVRYARHFAALHQYARFASNRLLSGAWWPRLRVRAWVREDTPALVRQRLAVFQLLLERTQQMAGFNVAGWTRRTMDLLREWHPNGIVRQVVGA